jgi:hypothetical protein
MDNNRIELYINDNYPQINENVQYVHPRHLQSVDNASCMEIEAGNCLDYILERYQVLLSLIEKLRYNGVLKINGINLDDILHKATFGHLNIQQTQQLLYNGRLSADTHRNMIQILQKHGLTVTHEVITDNQYFITAIRPLPNE